jgi:hypothetical protein
VLLLECVKELEDAFTLMQVLEEHSLTLQQVNARTASLKMGGWLLRIRVCHPSMLHQPQSSCGQSLSQLLQWMDPMQKSMAVVHATCNWPAMSSCQIA